MEFDQEFEYERDYPYGDEEITEQYLTDEENYNSPHFCQGCGFAVLDCVCERDECLLAVFRKRRFLDVRRQSREGLAQFEAEVVEIAFRCRVGAEFVDNGPEVGQRADWR